MNRQSAPKILVLIVLPMLLVLTTAQEARAQCATLDDCRKLVQLLSDQATTLNRAVAEKNSAIADQSAAIGLLQKQVADAQKDATVQASLADNKQKQLDAQEEIKKALRDQIEDCKKINTVSEASIKDQKEAIQALVKVSKRSALEKIADAIPSVAGIIALALVSR